ncbi:MAG: hypothetical protein ACFE9Q_10770 [Candidatus Hodarchaeota archaeon]
MKDNDLNARKLLGILLIYLAIQTPISALINNFESFTFALLISVFIALFGILLVFSPKP